MNRVCTAILRGDTILMVQMRVNGSVFWTLPGGGVEAGEKPEHAAGREALEETGLPVQVGRLLFIEQIESGECGCFLANPDSHKQASLGYDPEEIDLPAEERMLIGLAWKPLAEMKDDRQVRRVVEALNLKI